MNVIQWMNLKYDESALGRMTKSFFMESEGIFIRFPGCFFIHRKNSSREFYELREEVRKEIQYGINKI